MDNSVPLPLPHPPAHPSAPQIRSRITVVCAECKRLKLKCDRRNPCGSCTKRDTIARCIYSPAAAEKVDLHSLNNRLIHVEATLSLITSGQTPPVFQSSYPFSQLSSANPASLIFNSRPSPSPAGSRQHYHQHHSVSPGSLNASLSVSPQDLSSLWLDKLEHGNLPPQEINLPLSSSSVSNQNNLVKLEGISDTEFSSYPSASDANLTMRSQHMETHMSHLHLPHLSIYYPSSSSQRAQPPLSTASSSQAPTEALGFSDALASKPCVTPALIAYLPPIARATQLLQSAANVFSARPVPFPACLLSTLTDESGHGEKGDKKGKRKAQFSSSPTQWDAFKFRALCLIGGRGLTVGVSSAKFDRRERGKASARAREIFFGDGVSSRTGTSESLSGTPVEEDVMKLNAETEQVTSDQERISRERCESLSFFATVCMVLAMGAAASEASRTAENETPARGGWETSEFFHALAQQSLDVWEKNMVIPTVSGEDNSKAENANEEEMLDYLIANLLGIGYQLLQLQLKNDYEQRRNSLSKLLPIVAKMVNMARIFGLEISGKQSLRCKDEGLGTSKRHSNEDLNSKERWKRGKSWEKRRRKDGLKALIWWDIVFYELFISDTLGHPSLLSVPKLPRCANSFMSSDEVDSDHEEQEEILATENLDHVAEMYHSARCRLTKVAQMIKCKLVYPDCCCGYTLDQAAALEGQVNHFLENIPPPLRLKAGDDVSKGDDLYFPEEYSGTDGLERDALQMQRCELAIIAQRLIIMAYLPFLRQHPPSASQTDNTRQGSGNVWNPVLQPILSAAQRVVQASLHLMSCKTYQKHPQQVPSLLGLYPVEKALLDAVIICTYATTFHASQISKNAANSAMSGMQMLRDSDLHPESKALFERLQKRSLVSSNHALAHGTKRKHEQITVPGAVHFNAKSLKDSDNPSIDHASRNQPLTIHQERTPLDMLASKRLSPNGLINGRDPDTGEKKNKQVKKSHPYPLVGIRVRQGKGNPPFLKPKVGSSPTVTSRIRVDDRTSQHRQGLDLQPALNYIPNPAGDVQPPPDPQDSNAPVMPSLLQKTTYRSPPSLDHDLHGSSQAISFTVQSSRDGDNGSCMNDSARLDAYDRGRPPPQGMHFNPTLHTGPFEGDENREQQRTTFSSPYLQGVASATVDSSPYGSSGRLSPITGSPYTPSGNSMPTPTSSFGQVSRTSVPDRPTSSTYAHAYYHIDPNDDFNAATYNQTQVQENASYTGVRLGTAGELSPSIIDGSPIDGTGMAATVPSPPVYEKTSSAMYGIRLPMDGLGQEQIHNHPLLQQAPYGANQRQRHSISTTEQTWSSPPIEQRYWPPPIEDFKYYH
ncbi:hypothetical protein APHAL10511_007239 [Amanita phalloides]|nr:hypothetical protein APHAL10511_007239 [Amanita phalloides]